MQTRFLTIFFVLLFFISSCVTPYAPPPRSLRTVADFPAFELEPIELGLNVAMVGFKVEQQEMKLTYNPRTDEITLAFTYAFNKMSLQMCHVAREYFVDSLNKYISEFENRTLKKRGNTKDMYETATVLVKWGTFIQNGEATPEMRFGYYFDRNVVYFTMTAYPGENYAEVSLEHVKTSPPFTICMTIAQAKKLAEVTSVENLRDSLIERKNGRLNTEGDVYIEAE